MPRICALVIHCGCEICVESQRCLSIDEVLKKLRGKCGELDFEHVVITLDNKLVGIDTSICEDAVVKIARVSRGG